MHVLDLVMDNRVVLTPGHQVSLNVAIRREEPDPSHPVPLELTGGGGNGVTVTLDTALTKENYATLTITATDTAGAQEVAYAVEGRLAYLEDHEPLIVSVQVPTPDVGDTEEYAPGVSGVVKSLTINGSTLTYEVIDGIAILGGDIVLGDAATVEARAYLRTATCNPGFHTDFACAAWTDGVIGYSFANNWGDDAENARMRTIIGDAMEEWTRQTGIRFVPRSSGEHIQFRDGNGCSSGVGRVVFTGFDVQSVSLNNTGCDDIGRAMHEIGHAIGLYHEQQRNDRNSHVTVDFGRIREDKVGNFFQIGDFLIDRGPYDYDAIMHYEPWAFAKNKQACKDGLVESPPDLSECTVRPTNPPSAHIGQRDHLSEGDIFGAYKLYPPVFDIVGAMSGQTSDRFTLRLVYDRGRPQIDRVVWTSDRVATPIGTGNEITIRSNQVAPGPNVITASFIVAGETITSRSIVLNFSNDAPVIAVRASNGLLQQHMGQVFSVVATITDTEDGACEDCTVTWSPDPVTPTDSRVASFMFGAPGLQTITATIEDHGGATATASLTVDIVNTAPTVTILQPADGIVVSSGTFLYLSGRGADINSTTGRLSCWQLWWTSSNPSDELSFSPGCSPTLRVIGAGVRTITLTGNDGYASSAPATVEVTVTSCGTAGCPPTAYFGLSIPHTTDDVYFIERPMAIAVRLGDADHHEPITYRVFGRRVGELTTFPLATGSVMLLGEFTLETRSHVWTPSSTLGGAWSFCATPSQYRDYEIVLEATDSSGMMTTFSRIVTLGCDFI